MTCTPHSPDLPPSLSPDFYVRMLESKTIGIMEVQDHDQITFIVPASPPPHNSVRTRGGTSLISNTKIK
jgi:hypothetical protein